MWVAQENMLLAWTHGEKSGLKFLNRGIIEQTGNIIKHSLLPEYMSAPAKDSCYACAPYVIMSWSIISSLKDGIKIHQKSYLPEL